MATSSAFVLVVLVVLAAGCARAGGEPFQPTLSTVVPLAGGATVGQTFQSATGVVAGVDLVTATYAAPADPDGRLRVTLRAEPGGPVLASARVSGADLGDGEWVGVTFDEPVAVPETAVLEVAWRGETPLALFANAPA